MKLWIQQSLFSVGQFFSILIFYLFQYLTEFSLVCGENLIYCKFNDNPSHELWTFEKIEAIFKTMVLLSLAYKNQARIVIYIYMKGMQYFDMPTSKAFNSLYTLQIISCIHIANYLLFHFRACCTQVTIKACGPLVYVDRRRKIKLNSFCVASNLCRLRQRNLICLS